MAILPQPPRGAAVSEMDSVELSRWLTEVWRYINSLSASVPTPIEVDDDGTLLTAQAAKLDFTGDGVTAAAVGNDVTINIPGTPPYTLPIATDFILGGVKVGDGLSIDGTGVLSSDYLLVADDVKDPTGWIDPTAITVTYNDAADTITLTGTLEYMWRGVKKTLTSPWTSTAHSATTGVNYYLYSNDGDTFIWTTSFWDFADLQVAAIQHGVTDLWALREVHGLMPWSVHEEFHRTTGTYKQSGGVLGGYTIASTTAAERRPSVTATVVHDEDAETTITALPDNGPYTNATLTTTGIMSFNTAALEIVPVLANNPYWNSFTTPNWTQTLMANNSYMSVWLVAVPTANGTESQKYRYLWIQGQSNGALAAQQALTPSDLNLGTLTTLAAEFAFIAKVIIRYQGGNWDFTSVTALNGNRVSYIGSPAGAFEPLLGNPAIDGQVLSSTVAGVRSWITPPTGSGGTTQAFSAVFANEDTTQTVNVVNAAITATSKIAAYIDGEEAAILEMAARLVTAGTGSADIICHAPNGATGTYSGYISIA